MSDWSVYKHGREVAVLCRMNELGGFAPFWTIACWRDGEWWVIDSQCGGDYPERDEGIFAVVDLPDAETTVPPLALQPKSVHHL